MVLQTLQLTNSPALSILKKYWGYDSFRAPQGEIIDTILSDHNAIGLLPTGAGKSVCYQVPGLVKEGFTLVISPLVALMEDQVHQLISRGVKAAFIHSGMRRKEIDILLDNVIYGDYKFLYVSPERIHTEFFQERAHKMNVSLIAIDEAHCISQWGHDFRPAYLRILELQELLPGVPISAFTATATKDTLEDIKTYLGIEDSRVFTKSFIKDNLAYTVIKSSNKLRECLYILSRIKGSGIIYVRSRRFAEELAREIAKNQYSVDYYHAGLSYELRKKKQQSWISGETSIIVSTNAFGMGIDKADVRWVIHMDIPSTIEEYYQEAGRSGRDGLSAFAMLIYDDRDEETARKNLELNQVNHEIINEIYDKICRFLMVAMGSGFGETYEFDVNAFAKKYNYSIMQVLAVIANLEKAGIFQLTESVFQPSTLMLKTSQESIFRDTSTVSEFKQFLQALVRNYEGLFTRYVKITEEKIARFTKLPLGKVKSYLKNISDLGLGFYSPRTDVPKIFFLTNRTEPKSLNVDYEKLNKLYESRWQKLESMFELLDTVECRESVILEYFGEKVKANCGRCDICKGSAKVDFTSKDLSDFSLYLSKELSAEIDLFDLLHWWPLNKRRKTLAMLSILENEGKISVRNKKIRWIEA